MITFQEPNTVYVYMRINYEPFIIYIAGGGLSNFLGEPWVFRLDFRGLSKISANEGIRGRGHPEIGIILKKFSVPWACFSLLHRILLKHISAFSVALIVGKANFVSRWPQIKWLFTIFCQPYIQFCFYNFHCKSYTARLKTVAHIQQKLA